MKIEPLNAFKKLAKFILLIVFFLTLTIVVLRKINLSMRGDSYEPELVQVSPKGNCALSEHHFKGGERGYWKDPIRLLLLLEGDAFFTVTDLRSGKVLRDSTTAIFAIPATSVTYPEGEHSFSWSQDSRQARFPIDNGSGWYEWSNMSECATSPQLPQYASLLCSNDSREPKCYEIIARLKRK